MGWFGPRGLASLVFALLALEALGPVSDEAVAVIAATVLLSVVAHGMSAAPLAARYGRAMGGVRSGDPPEARPDTAVTTADTPVAGESPTEPGAPGTQSTGRMMRRLVEVPRARVRHPLGVVPSPGAAGVPGTRQHRARSKGGRAPRV